MPEGTFRHASITTVPQKAFECTVSWIAYYTPPLISRDFDGQPGGLTPDNVLDNITLFWLTNTAVSAARL